MSDFNIDFAKLGPVENGDIIPTGSDSEFTAVFHMAKVPNFEETDYTEVPHLRLQAPGNQKTVYDQPVRMSSYPGRPSDPERFPREWAAFQRGVDGTVGTLICEWSEATQADARRLELLGINTVEQLAQVADSNLEGLGMGGRMIRDRARGFLHGQSAGTSAREQELANTVANQSDQISKLTDIVNSLLEKQTNPAPAPAKGAAKAKETADA